MSDAKFIELVTAAHEYLTQHQELLRQTFGLASYERWDWDGERGTVVFSSGGIPGVMLGGRFADRFMTLRRYSCRLTSCQDCPPSGESSVSVANPSAVSTR